MSTCNCASDWRAIPKERRIVVELPGAVVHKNGVVHKDASKLHFFDRECPIHGYKEITDGESQQGIQPVSRPV